MGKHRRAFAKATGGSARLLGSLLESRLFVNESVYYVKYMSTYTESVYVLASLW